MTKDAPAFDFYPERWLAGVADLSDLEQIAYLRLLCHQWLKDGLPEDHAALSRLGGRKVTSAILEKLPVCEDGKRRNKRLEVIRAEQRARIAKASEKARKMAEGRWGKGDAQAMHKHSTNKPQALLNECPPPTTHPTGDKSPDVGRTAARAAPVDDEAWIAELESDLAYQGINIRAELGKMQRWCQANNKQPSRRRFINWINRAEKPITAQGQRPPAKHAAYTPESATAGMTGQQIGDW